MVLPPPAADNAPGAPEASWLRPLKRALRLSEAGVLVRVAKARPEALGDLVRALLPEHPELEVHTEAWRVVESPRGAVRVLVPRPADADWLNINRPLFTRGALRVVLFCDDEVSQALMRQAVDFFDWISHHVDCPSMPARHGVAGLRCALAARVPGISWQGGDLEACFAAAFPRRALHRVSAARPFAELRAEVKSHRREWLAWSDVEGPFVLRRVRWALAEARRKTKAILVEPAVESPGWRRLHGRTAQVEEAHRRLENAGARNPGRLAALAGLEPEALELVAALLEKRLDEQALETALRQAEDPGATVGRLALEQGLVSERDTVRDMAAPPVLRALAMGLEDRQRLRRLRNDELAQVFGHLTGGAPVDVAEAAWWAAWAAPVSSPVMDALQIPLVNVFIIEPELRSHSVDELKISQIANSVGDLEAAVLWGQLALEATPEKAEAIINFASVLGKLGRYGESEELLRKIISSQEKVLGSTHPEYATSLNALAAVLEMQGKYEEAEKLLRESLAIDEKVQGSTHPDYGASLHALAAVLERQGKYEEAKKLLRESLAIKEKALGSTHPEYGVSLHTLAEVLERQGKYEEAEKLLRESLAIDEKALGSDHPYHSASLHVLAMALEGQGKYEEAERLLRQVISINEKTLGDIHPSYGISLHTLAQVLKNQGKYAEAEKLLRQVISIYGKTLGNTHPSYGISLHTLAQVLEGLGRHEEAEKLLRESLVIKAKTLGRTHPEYGVSLHDLAGVLESQGKYAEAERLLREALVIREKALGSTSPNLCPTLANLGFVLARQSRLQEGMNFAQRSVDIAIENFGLIHPYTAQSLNLLAQLQARLNKPEAAVTARQALEAIVASLGPEHPTTQKAGPILRRIIKGKGE